MENNLKNEFEKLLEDASESDFQDNGLEALASRFPDKVIFSTSFSYEDQVITHLIKNLDIDIFTLDTGRLFEQTYETWANTRAFFKKRDQSLLPGYGRIEKICHRKRT